MIKTILSRQFRIRLVLILFPIMSILCFLQLIYPPLETLDNIQYKTFSAEEGLMSIDYPSNWVADSTPNGSHGDVERIGFIEPIKDSHTKVAFTKSPLLVTQIEQVTDWAESRIIQGGWSYDLISKQQIQINSKTLVVREYLRSQESILGPLYIINDQCKAYDFIIANSGYSIAFCTDPSRWQHYEDLFTHMIESIRFSAH